MKKKKKRKENQKRMKGGSQIRFFGHMDARGCFLMPIIIYMRAGGGCMEIQPNHSPNHNKPKTVPLVMEAVPISTMESIGTSFGELSW